MRCPNRKKTFRRVADKDPSKRFLTTKRFHGSALTKRFAVGGDTLPVETFQGARRWGGCEVDPRPPPPPASPFSRRLLAQQATRGNASLDGNVPTYRLSKRFYGGNVSTYQLLMRQRPPETFPRVRFPADVSTGRPPENVSTGPLSLTRGNVLLFPSPKPDPSKRFGYVETLAGIVQRFDG